MILGHSRKIYDATSADKNKTISSKRTHRLISMYGHLMIVKTSVVYPTLASQFSQLAAATNLDILLSLAARQGPGVINLGGPCLVWLLIGQ